MKLINRLERISFVTLITVFVVCVTGFAGAYYGLGQTGNGLKGNPGIHDTFYFSFVTITTLGYGDLQPEGWSKAVAAIEGLTGLFLVGVFIGIFVARLVSTRQEALIDFLANERLADLLLNLRMDPEGPFSGQYADLDSTPPQRELTDQLILKGRYLTRLQAIISRIAASDHLDSQNVLNECIQALASSIGVINNQLEQIELKGTGFHLGDTHRLEHMLDHVKTIQVALTKMRTECDLTDVETQIAILGSHLEKLHSLDSELQP